MCTIQIPRCHDKNALRGRCFTLTSFAPHLFLLGWLNLNLETGLGRWTVVVAVISVGAYPFLAFSDLTCHLEDTGWIMAISKAYKPDNFESRNSLKLSFKNIHGLYWNFVDFESFLESNSPDILDLCETNLYGSIDSGNFSERAYLPLIWKYTSTHVHGLAVYVKEGLPFARELSLENSAASCLCFRLPLLNSASYFFFLYRSPSLSLCMVFDSILSN